MNGLRQAIAAGYNDASALEKDKDFDNLRDRADFKVILAELQQRTAS